MFILDYKEYAKKIRQASAESCVLLKNDNVLPIKNEIVSVFGRTQIDTYYCGTGSGGMVNIPYLVNVVDGLRDQCRINEELTEIYKEFINENPFDKGQGWACEPFSQKELELSEELVKQARVKSDMALIVIGRSAGEDKDCKAEEGSYYLTKTEKNNMDLICKHFEKTVVILNVGGVMDMSFVDVYNPGAVMIAWHGGIESGNGYADVLCGTVNPSGAMPDSIAYNLEDYPSSSNFGSETQNIYEKDIYVGYRYFTSFAKDKMMYPFGYSLSYTDFKLEINSFSYDKSVKLEFTITNIGKVAGKKTAQVYCSSPSDKLYKEERSLCSFAKTKELAPNESQKISLTIDNRYFTSFSDEKTAFVLEKGKYVFHVGFNCVETSVAGEFILDEEKIVEKVNSALAPIKEFTSIKGKVPTRKYKMADRILEQRKDFVLKTDKNYTFDMVKNSEISVKEFVNDLSDFELICLTRGEGMCSPKVTAGTASAFGGVTDSLHNLRKIPIACCADGPSGIRMDCGTMAVSVPNGTALASTFNEELNEELFEFVALEMVKNNVDTLLGPGMNIHRTPLCGRNFEYFSEDPVLSGKMAAAQLRAMNKYGVTGTIKHFALNNQEFARKTVDAVVSERAIREIYLRGFEIAVKEGEAYSIMTAYNPINGTQAASNIDLNTYILREDWGFNGIVMTDWWATMNKEGEEASIKNTADMINSQNDLYMVTSNAEENSLEDDTEEKLASGEITRFELLRSAENILNAILRFNCSKEKKEIEVQNEPVNTNRAIIELGTFNVENSTVIDTSIFKTQRGNSNRFNLSMKENGRYALDFELFADAVELAQIPMTVTVNSACLGTISLKGQTSNTYHVEFDMYASINVYVELFFGESGMFINNFNVSKIL